VPLSLFEQLSARISGQKKGAAPLVDLDDDVPTVDSPRIRKPVVNTPVVNTPMVPQQVIAPPVVSAPPPSQLSAQPPIPAQPLPAQTPIKEKRKYHILLSKPTQTILLVFILGALPLYIPKLANMLSLNDQPYNEMVPDPRELITFKKSSGLSDSAIPGTGEATGEETYSATGVDDPVIVGSDHPIEDPSKSLDPFYAALARTEAKQPGAITRITHYGDSPITNDGLTAPTRRMLQEQFGDAGHGFILIDKPWAWYGHQAITFSSGGGWNDNAMGPASNASEFGLGGAYVTASGAGKYARFAPASDGAMGKNFSRMEVYYLNTPGGGQFSVSVNGQDSQMVSTDSPSTASGFYEIRAKNSGANSFEVRSGSGTVRLFGAVIENDGPGIVYDSLGVNGAYAGLLVTAMAEAHWQEQLRHRKPDLVILNYGTNESQYASADQMQRYERDLHEVIRRVRVGLPGVAILVISPMDRGKKVGGGKIITWPSIPAIVEMQRRVALEENCAFFNMYQAMGGEGTMAKWAAAKNMVSSDLIHPSPKGAEIIGGLTYEALKDGFTKYKARAGK